MTVDQSWHGFPDHSPLSPRDIAIEFNDTARMRGLANRAKKTRLNGDDGKASYYRHGQTLGYPIEETVGKKENPRSGG
jgi:hypothetical protein